MPVGPPSHLRRRLGLALREARDALELSQAQVGTTVGKAQAWVNRLETAQQVKIKPGELEKLMDAVGIDDEDEREKLRSWAQSPYTGPGLWMESRSDATWWQERQQIEQDARVIRAVHLNAIDALLQTEGYMRRQFELGSLANLERRVAERLRRQTAILQQENPPACTFLLFEVCLDEDMGDPAMMLEQIEWLRTISEWPQITILIKPYGAPLFTNTFGWTMLQFNSVIMHDFASVEYGIGAATIDDDAGLRFFQARWETFRSASLTMHDSRLLLERKRADYQEKVKGLQSP